MGLEVARSTLCREMGRLAKAAEPSYEKLVQNVRGSSVVYPDETGWRIGGRSSWLWAFVTAGQTVYRIAPGRGFAEASAVLGEDYSGLLGSDGWAPLPPLRPGHAPDLPGSPAAPLPGAARGGCRLSRGIPAPSAKPSADGLGGEGPSRRRADQSSRRAHCHRTFTGSPGTAAGARVDRSRQPALGQALEAPRGRVVRLLGTARDRSDQLAGRAGDLSCRDQSQVLRRQPNGSGRPSPGDLDERSAHLPSETTPTDNPLEQHAP